MIKNVGQLDCIARTLAALALATCAFLAPYSLPIRIAAFALPGLYMAFTALAGTCLGYRLMGRSTCPLPKNEAR